MEQIKRFFREYNSDERSESFDRTMRILLVGVGIVVVLAVLAALGQS